jgi:hypothetical protein
LSTVFHELGHGLAALAVGGEFERLAIYANGSGVAYSRGVPSGVPDAIVSAGGLVGPAVFAALAFVAGRRGKLSRIFLALLAASLLTLTILFVRNGFGLVFCLLVVAGFGWVAVRHSTDTAQTVLVFLAVQASLSVFSHGDYLFTDTAHTGAGVMPSDVAQMANALGGTYWMWGLACGAFSVLVLALGMWLFWRITRDEPRPKAPRV